LSNDYTETVKYFDNSCRGAIHKSLIQFIMARVAYCLDIDPGSKRYDIMSAELFLSTRDLRKVYRTDEVETTALDGVTLGVKPGEFIAIMGPSGCGKSTLLNVMGLIDHPSAGSYLFDGEETSEFREKQCVERRKGKIGFIFQNFNLIDELNVFDNVEMPLIFMKVGWKQRRERVREVLDRMKIGHRARHYPQQLSGGQQQRVAICRAVVSRPKLILADEPTGNLDSKNGEQVMELLTELNREGTTILMVTHSERYAAYAHRIVQLFDGRISTRAPV
jgi:putative ABC transport system ATP-binding protein